MFIPGVATQTIVLSLKLADQITGLFPRAVVYDNAGAFLVNVDLDTDSGGGVYMASWVVPTASRFVVDYKIFDDSARTAGDDISDQYETEADMVVSDQPVVQIPEVVGSALQC